MADKFCNYQQWIFGNYQCIFWFGENHSIDTTKLSYKTLREKQHGEYIKFILNTFSERPNT